MTRALKHQWGVTLIELLIGLAVLSLLLGLGVPAFRAFLANTQTRNAADAILNGIQLARAEAIKHNKPVQFQLGTQTEWTVSVVNPAQQVQYRPKEEGSPNAVVTVTPGGADTLTFNGLGGTTTNNDNSFTVTQIDITNNLSMSGLRALRIVISPSGGSRMCDPPTNTPALPTGDPRSC
jgi:type IV fimbrial biogenesis protein FimT